MRTCAIMHPLHLELETAIHNAAQPIEENQEGTETKAAD